MAENHAGLGLSELSQFHAHMVLEPQQMVEGKVTARAAADLLRPVLCNPSLAHFPTAELWLDLSLGCGLGLDGVYSMPTSWHVTGLSSERITPL